MLSAFIHATLLKRVLSRKPRKLMSFECQNWKIPHQYPSNIQCHVLIIISRAFCQNLTRSFSILGFKLHVCFFFQKMPPGRWKFWFYGKYAFVRDYYFSLLNKLVSKVLNPGDELGIGCTYNKFQIN